MRVRICDDGRLLVFPEGHEFRAVKMWLLEMGNTADDYRDVTAGCYVIRSHALADLKTAGFKCEILSHKAYLRMISEALERGYAEPEEGDSS